MDISTIIIIIAIVVVLVLICLCLAIANYSLDSFYDKYSDLDKVGSESKLTTFGFFNYINKEYFNGQIKICRTDEGVGAGAYAKGVLFLTSRSMQSNSLASLSIIAHEMGHAQQDFSSNKLKRMTALRILGKIVGVFMFPLLIAGVIMLFFGGNWFYCGIGLLAGGLLIFILSVIIKAITISIEKEASKNAIVFLSEVINEKELKQCKKFLNDARLTYWGDMFKTLLGWTMLTRKRK